jgi:hypothetical protein
MRLSAMSGCETLCPAAPGIIMPSICTQFERQALAEPLLD